MVSGRIFSNLLVLFLTFAILLTPQAGWGKIVKKGDLSFQVQDDIAEKYPALIKLILNTESMTDEERRYWLNLLPSMTEPQIDRLFDILETERKKLIELEKKYKKKLVDLNLRKGIEIFETLIKKSYAQSGETNKSIALPVFEATAIPPIVIRRYKSFEDIPTITLPTNVESEAASEDQTKKKKPTHTALISSASYKALKKENFLDYTADNIMLAYAMLLMDERKLYRSFLGEEEYKAYIKLGAQIGVEIGRDRDVEKLKRAFPQYDLKMAQLPPAEAVRIGMVEIQETLSSKPAKPWGLFSQALNLSYYRNTSSCDTSCKDLLEESLTRLAENADALEDSFKKRILQKQSFYYLAGPLFDYLAVLSRDSSTQKQLHNIAISLVRIALSETRDMAHKQLEWGGDSSEIDAKFLSFVEEKLDQKGSWIDEEANLSWYRLLLIAYQEGSIHELYDYLAEKVEEQSHDSSRYLASLLEGPLVEAAAYKVIYTLINGVCFQYGGDILHIVSDIPVRSSRQASASNAYIERKMINILNSNDIYARFCSTRTRNTAPKLANSDFQALVIGISDTAKGEAANPANPYYLGAIPRNDANGVKAALERNLIDWQVEQLLDEEATSQAIVEQVSKILGRATPTSNIVIYYSGHGHGGRSAYDKDDYVISHDKESIAISWFEKQMRSSKAGKVVVILDSCRDSRQSGRALKAANQSRDRLITRYFSESNAELPQSMAIIYSTRAGESASADRVSGFSYYTKHLIDALNGKANIASNGAGSLTLGDILDYTYMRVDQDGETNQMAQESLVKGGADWDNWALVSVNQKSE